MVLLCGILGRQINVSMTGGMDDLCGSGFFSFHLSLSRGEIDRIT